MAPRRSAQISRRALCKNPVRGGKDLERSNCVEQLNARISQNTDLPRFGFAYGEVFCSISFHDCALCRIAERHARAVAFVAKRGINGMFEGDPGSLGFQA